MALTSLDWIVVAVYGTVVLAIGFGMARRAGGSVENYFVAGRSLPWWLAGTSIAATWFASDAPLATAALVRQQGVFGNWLWWYEAAGILMLTFFYARLWRRRRGAHRRGVDRDSLRRRARAHPARLFGGLPGAHPQRRGDGLGHAGDGEVQRRAAGVGIPPSPSPSAAGWRSPTPWPLGSGASWSPTCCSSSRACSER